MTTERYDIISIGTGAGGGTLAYALAPSGKRILLLERGGFLPREAENWDSKAVFVHSRYTAHETWYDRDGKAFHPGIHYFVGGNTKVYGAALLRFRHEDFGEITHHGGISPAWPISYADLAPYYTTAEQLYHVLDVWCKAHDVDNLYVVDGSFFFSSTAVNPALKIMANALRVAEHVHERLT